MWWSIIGIGGSAFITSTDKKTALKGYQVWEDGDIRAGCETDSEKELAREAFIYKRMGEHPNILTCHGLEEVHPGVNSLRLEYAPLGDVRKYIRDHGDAPPSLATRLQMALGIARGLSHMHLHKVQYCDMSCRNILLFNDLSIKLADFGGSIVEGHEEYHSSVIYEELAYELPMRGRTYQDRPGWKRDLFALGSAVYEVLAWGRPYEGLGVREIEAKYAANEFPDLSGIVAGEIIRKCWEENCEGADEVVAFLERLVESHAELNGEVNNDAAIDGSG